MVALFACLAIDARFTMVRALHQSWLYRVAYAFTQPQAVLSDLRKARLVTQVTRTRLKSWRPQTSGVSFARSQQVQAMMGGAVKGGEEKEKEKEQGIEPGKPEDW